MQRNWLVIRTEYVEGDGITLADIAQRHGLNASSLRHRAANEKWAIERRKFIALRQQSIEEGRGIAAREAATKLAQQVLKLDERALLLAQAAMARVARLLQTADPETGADGSPKGKGLSALDILNLTAALRNAQQIYRLAGNQATERADVDVGCATLLDLMRSVARHRQSGN